jgi:hypothetical protein
VAWSGGGGCTGAWEEEWRREGGAGERAERRVWGVGAEIDTARPGRRRAPQHFAPGSAVAHGMGHAWAKGGAQLSGVRHVLAHARGKRGGGGTAKRAAHLLFSLECRWKQEPRPRVASKRGRGGAGERRIPGHRRRRQGQGQRRVEGRGEERCECGGMCQRDRSARRPRERACAG